MNVNQLGEAILGEEDAARRLEAVLTLLARPDVEYAAAADPEARWNLPLWWLERLRAQYPDDWQAIVEAQNVHPPMTLRVNRRRGGVAEYLGKLMPVHQFVHTPCGR